MKTDLANSIGVAIVGAIIAFVVCNLFLADQIQPIDVKVVDTSVNTELAEPSPEVFNYKSINPTVEVYVGDCTEFDSYGECIDDISANQGNN